MRVMGEASRAVLALTNRLVDVGVPPLKASEFWRLLDEVQDPSQLVGLTAAQLTRDLPGRVAEGERIAALLDSGMTLAVRLDALRDRGVWAITPFDADYPPNLRDRLGASAPPVFYGAGDSKLLTSVGIGIVGSRDVTEEGAEVARSAARAAARHGLSVMSGGARGVDQLAMSAAEEAGGTAVGILADSLESAIAKADTRRALMDGRVCLCTPYKPDAHFNVGNAMGRNKVIYALSRVTLVVATAQDSGGTWAGAKEALDKKYGSVAVWRGAGGGPGNEAIEKAGAIGITEVAELLDIEPTGQARTDAHQLSLIGPTADRLTPTAIGDGPPATLEEDDNPTPPMPTIPGAVRPVPTGICWCGCGKAVDADEYFLPRHAPGAAQRAVIKHFGSVEAFLALMGEQPSTEGSARWWRG